MTRRDDRDDAFRIGFLLLPGFALMSFASAVEPLRAANLLAGKTLYEMRFFGADTEMAQSSVGVLAPIEPPPRSALELDLLLVVAGGDPARYLGNVALVGFLRRMARSGLALGGISGGPFLLAAAGLLADRRFTVHWEHAAALSERWPDLIPERVRFVIDRDRITCGGGVAPLDLMHALIEDRHGPDFARAVSDWFLHRHVDPPTGPQRSSTAARYGIRHAGLIAVLERMEASVEEPTSRAEMARLAGVSERHLDRLFAANLNSSFQQEYLRIRLERGRSLLRQSPMKIAEIALACGFSGASQFSRAFRRLYGESPSGVRK
ncbi:transcriptional regulator GlxA family with amidase domain [Rhizobium sp. SG_E_25_P2]|uniref:GlxA family transcriptional regulator n=1 Tax=Rhizobium sp. SG_E_25_P2 TaxID=2879942 RepID=UPI00247690DC|nr:GlxA family transcriptional regulator [Rhizobium sp. SG_E_25_P2]MDH6269396.1 transcriptional regulator GlxA family with amidase domain [Rhizobium sp. SG_E_25_P2]